MNTLKTKQRLFQALPCFFSNCWIAASKVQLHTGETYRRKLLNFYKEMLRIFKNPNKKWDESFKKNFKLTQPLFWKIYVDILFIFWRFINIIIYTSNN